jgi:hypothetical protein
LDFFVVFGVVRHIVVFILVTAVNFAQNFGLQFSIVVLVCFVVGIELEDVEGVLGFDLAIQINFVCDLVFLLHQIQFITDGRVVLVLVTPDLEEDLNHVLRPFLQICGFVQNGTELVEHGDGDGRVELFEVLAALLAQVDCNLHTVVRWLMEKKQKYLGYQHLMDHLLVAQVSEESGARNADDLVVALKGLPELHNKAFGKELADLRKLGVNNGCAGCEDGGKG